MGVMRTCNVYTLHPAPTHTTQRLCLRLTLSGTEPREAMANDGTKRERNRDGFSHTQRRLLAGRAEACRT